MHTGRLFQKLTPVTSFNYLRRKNGYKLSVNVLKHRAKEFSLVLLEGIALSSNLICAVFRRNNVYI